LLAVLAFAPILLLALAMILDALFTEQGEPGGPGVPPAMLAIGLWSVGVLWGILHVARREDFAGNERAWWIAALVLFFPVTVPILWWSVVRPLPEHGSARTIEHRGDRERPRPVQPLQTALIYWLIGAPALLLVAFVVLLILHALGVIHLSDT